MDVNFTKVKNYLLDLEYTIVSEDEKTGLFTISKPEEGIVNMIVVCADPIVILEQPLFKIKNESLNVYKQLLQKNRDIIHGAFALNENGEVFDLERIAENYLAVFVESKCSVYDVAVFLQ